MNKFFARLLGAIPQNRPASEAARPQEPQTVQPVDTDEDDQTFAMSKSQQAKQDQERDLAEQRQSQRTERRSVWQRLGSWLNRKNPLPPADEIRGSRPKKRKISRDTLSRLSNLTKATQPPAEPAGTGQAVRLEPAPDKLSGRKPSWGQAAKELFKSSRPTERHLGRRPQVARAAAAAPLEPIARGFRKIGMRRTAKSVAGFGRTARQAIGFQGQTETETNRSLEEQEETSATQKPTRPAGPQRDQVRPVGRRQRQQQQAAQAFGLTEESVGPRQRQQAPGGGFMVVGGGGMLGTGRRKVAAGAARGLRSMGMRGMARTAIGAGGGGGGMASSLGASGIMRVAGPIGLFIGAVGGAVSALKKWTDSIVESRRHLGKYNGQIAASLARLDVGDIKRNIKFAEGTSGTTSGLNEAINEFRDALLPITIELRNLFNDVLIWVVKGTTAVVSLLNQILEELGGSLVGLLAPALKTIQQLLGEDDNNQGQIPAQTFLNELQRGIQPNRPPLQPINP